MHDTHREHDHIRPDRPNNGGRRSFNFYLTKLKEVWKDDIPKRIEYFNKLVEVFEDDVKTTFHHELYEFYHEELSFTDSPVSIYPSIIEKKETLPEKIRPSLKKKSFEMAVEELGQVIDEDGDRNNQINANLDLLEKIHDSLFKHLKAYQMSGHCHSSASKSKLQVR